MRKTSRFLVAVLIAVSVRQALSFQSSSDSGQVTVVYDGDTIQIRMADGTLEKVRLIGVDSPEMDDPREDVLFWAVMAKRFAFHHVYRKKVRLSFDRERRDKYGRLLAYVWTEDGRLFNQFLIGEGFASAFLDFPFEEKNQALFKEAEKEAKRLEKGMWMKKAPPLVPSSKAADAEGRVVTIEFTCSEVAFRRSFAYLSAADNGFEAVVAAESLPLFPQLDSYKGRPLSAIGFLEIFRGKPQIMIVMPRQLRMR